MGREVETIAPSLLAAGAACPWWVVILAAAIILFLRGADPAMRWLDVWDRIASRHRSAPNTAAKVAAATDTLERAAESVRE